MCLRRRYAVSTPMSLLTTSKVGAPQAVTRNGGLMGGPQLALQAILRQTLG